MRPALALAFLVVVAGLAGCLVEANEPAAQGMRPLGRVERLLGLATDEIVVVAHVSDGREPSPGTVAAVVTEFSRLLGKPVALEVRPLPEGVARAGPWTLEQLEALADSLQADPWPSGIGLLHAVAMPGCFDYEEYDAGRGCIEGGLVGGVAFVLMDRVHADVMTAPVRDAPLVGWYAEERYLYVHELGHAVGLIGLEVPDTHGRPATTGCACHSSDPESVMYQSHRQLVYTPGETLVERILTDNLHHYTFSDLDIADVRTFQKQIASDAEAGPKP